MDAYHSLQSFVLIVGNARTGSSLLGAIIDAHPLAVVANESAASANFWRDLDRGTILAEIVENSRRNAAAGRPSGGYHYRIDAVDATSDLLVVGDKVWNPATLLLHGDHGLILRLAAVLEVPVRIIHAIRDPLDTIATMHARSGAPLPDRIRWYFMHCDAAQAIRNRMPPDAFLDAHHEDLLADPDAEIARLCRFLGLPLDVRHLAGVKRLLFAEPHRTRSNVDWNSADRAEIAARSQTFDFLARYAAGRDPVQGFATRPGR
jgi:hypothetical protein